MEIDNNFQSSGVPKRLLRDEKNKMFGGVCAGLANYFNLDPALLRIIMAFLAVFGCGGLLLYIIMWIIMPSR